MTAIGIKAKERELIKEIGSDSNLLESALRYIKKKKREQNNLNCQFTQEELEYELQKSEEDIQVGRVLTQEEVRKLHPEWK
jgi:hypothetical protein